MKKEVNGWRIGFVKYKFTYGGLLMGEPKQDMNERFINNEVQHLINGDYEKDAINIFEDYAGYFGGTEECDKCVHALKPIMITFALYELRNWQKCVVITFADENEQPDDVIERITKNHELKTIEFSF